MSVSKSCRFQRLNSIASFAVFITAMVAMLRPRWSLRYILCVCLLLVFGFSIIFKMPLLSDRLPQYSGEYDVGTIDIEVPCERRNVSDAVLKGGGKPAFELETVLFSLFYPSVKNAQSQQPHHRWISKLHAHGYAAFAKMDNFVTDSVFGLALWMLAGSTTIPANVDVPLHGTAKGYSDYEAEHPNDDYGLPNFPVIVFSHGMASTRTSYTQYCGELASRGYVVAAVEHRDGSAPGSVIMNNGTERNLFLVTPDMLQTPPAIDDFKAIQLAMRQAEVEETVRVLRLINDGLGGELYKMNPRGEGVDLDAWRGRLNVDEMIVGGHSYGATLALQALKGAPSATLPFFGGIILDPGKQSGPLNDEIDVPIIILHSESWSQKTSMFYGRPHFDVVKDLTQGVMDKAKKFAWFLTAKGTTHPTVTDAPLIEPTILNWSTGQTIDAKEGVLLYVKLSHYFANYVQTGNRKGVLSEWVSHPEYGKEKDDSKLSRELAKYYEVHVAPSHFCPVVGYCGEQPD